MTAGRDEHHGSDGRAGKSRPVLVAAVLVPILIVLLVLTYYFAARDESDWVLVTAFTLCAVAVAARLVGAVWPGRRR